MKTPPEAALGGLLRDMPPDLQADLARIGALVRYRPGQLIHQRGDRKPGLSIVVSGAVLFSATDAEGVRVATTRMNPGDSFGEFTLFAGLPRTHDATAIGETEINQITRAPFFALLDRRPALRDHLLKHLTRNLALAVGWLDDERRLPLRTRLAKRLLEFAAPDEDTHVVNITQHELAETLGVSRVALGQAVAFLRGEELIETGYGAIIVRDIEALSGWIAAETGLEPLTVE